MENRQPNIESKNQGQENAAFVDLTFSEIIQRMKATQKEIDSLMEYVFELQAGVGNTLFESGLVINPELWKLLIEFQKNSDMSPEDIGENIRDGFKKIFETYKPKIQQEQDAENEDMKN